MISDNVDTFNDYGEKLLFNEFKIDEDIFNNIEKLIRVISNQLNKKPFTNNSDWGGAYVWSIKSNNNFTGTFVVLGDDDLVVLNRTFDEDTEEYKDDVLTTITNANDLNKLFLNLKQTR